MEFVVETIAEVAVPSCSCAFWVASLDLEIILVGLLRKRRKEVYHEMLYKSVEIGVVVIALFTEL